MDTELPAVKDALADISDTELAALIAATNNKPTETGSVSVRDQLLLAAVGLLNGHVLRSATGVNACLRRSYRRGDSRHTRDDVHAILFRAVDAAGCHLGRVILSDIQFVRHHR